MNVPRTGRRRARAKKHTDEDKTELAGILVMTKKLLQAFARSALGHVQCGGLGNLGAGTVLIRWIFRFPFWDAVLDV